MLENMLENNFLLIGLIILAVICIYLLYKTLSWASELSTVKQSMSMLVTQNRKFNEIVTFLIERIENLEYNHQPSQPVEQTPQQPLPPVTTDIDNILDSMLDINEELDDDFNQSTNNEVMAEDFNFEDYDSLEANPPTQAESGGVSQDPEPAEPAIVAQPEPEQEPVVVVTLQEPTVDKHVTIPDGLDEPFHTMVQDILEPSSPEQDIVASILLDTDDDHVSIGGLPKNKEELNLKYTVKQLKTIAHQLNVSIKGNKTELIDRIYAKL